MNANMKKALFIIGGIATAIALAVAIFVITFDINRYKPRIEAAAFEATGMKVRVNGRLKLTLFPNAGVSLEDIIIQNQSADVASVKRAEVGIKLLPLVMGNIRIRKIGLISPEFSISRDSRGHLNLERPEKKPAGKLFEVGKIYIEKGHLFSLDEKTGVRSEASDCDLAIRNIVIVPGEPIAASSFNGTLSCREVKAKGLEVTDLHVAIKAGGGKFEADPVMMKMFGGEGAGSVIGTASGKSREYEVDFAIKKFRFEDILASFDQKKSIRGKLNINLHLAMRGKSAKEMTRTARGEVSLRGQDLVHESIDLDHVLENYEDSQNIGLVDIGAFLVAGPLGPLLTKGYDFGSVYTASLGGKSKIQRLVSDWKVTDGVAQAQDVAFSTMKNRVAVQGGLDFVNSRFDDMTVAVLDEKGCVRFWQKIHGNFRKPRIEKVSVLKSITGSLINLYEKTSEFLGEECDIFYAGSVKQPE